jgi:hypothetical protein
VLRPGAQMLFTTIEPVPGLSPAQRRLAGRSGPSAVLARTSYESLLATAGFADVEIRDITPAYRATQHAWIDATRRRAGPIRTATSDAAFEQRLADRERALDAIDDGVLRRTSYMTSRR